MTYPKEYSKGLPGLAERRRSAGYTQEAMAAALGVTRSTIAMWETAGAWPSAALLPAIADMLLCSIDDLYREPPRPDCNMEGGGAQWSGATPTTTETRVVLPD